ncbi:MAG: SRPBCC family protein [Candidatus Obscuribacterales bacterium]|jgi:uncharacterized protein YndB with AHSA1/START domain|nr:SRPBCC family protein [Candidatus Obscuribacterales bacterium]
MDIEGILAIGGFWLVILVLVLKKPISTLLEQSKVRQAEIAALNDRIQKMEGLLASVTEDCNRVNHELGELKQTADFSHKLLREHQRSLESIQSAQLAQSVKILEPTQPGDKGIPGGSQPRMLNSNAPKAEDFGKVINEHTIRFERTFNTSRERLWSYITETPNLSAWLADGFIEDQFGGRVELVFSANQPPDRQGQDTKIRGLVSHCEANKSLAFSWIDTENQLESLVSIELVDAGEQTKLILTHSRLPHSKMHEVMASWHAHLDILMARVRNIMPPDFVERFREVIQVYITIVATVAISATPVSAAGTTDYQSISADRSHLMVKYDNLWREVDTLQRDMSTLKRDSSNDAKKELDQINNDLKDRYRDLQQLEYQIRDLDKALKN